jgi:signal transduction histidine kinase
LRVPAFLQTVRFKLTLWYSGLLLIFGIAFVVALNLAAQLDRPAVDLDNLKIEEIQYETVRGPGNALTVVPRQITLKEAEDTFYNETLDNLRFWSLIALVGLVLASGVGGYMLSGMLLQPVRDITDTAAVITATNLTQRINHVGPNDELKSLADTFDSMIGRLQRSFDQQRLFVQDASHELRTPLAAIRMNIEVTEMEPNLTEADYRGLLDTVKTQTERLTRLSEDLLLLSTSEGDTPDTEPVNIHALGREVVAQLSPVAAARNVTLAVEGAREVEAEANGDLLFRCVFNLVENAIKYSGEGSHVVVRAAGTPSGAEVAVIDNGVGIPPEHVTRLFDRFYRVDRGRSRREGGTGLGLAIVKGLVESMGGSVHVTSTEGKGTTFTLMLRAAAPEPPAAARAPLSQLRTAG